MSDMKISATGLELIKRFEGFSATVYRCPAGYDTIGYGHMIKAAESFPEAGIDQSEAEKLLKIDVIGCENIVNQLVKVFLRQGQFDALVSLIYNIGGHAFEKSTLLAFLNAGKPEEAGREFNRWIYCKGKILEGLVRRRSAEFQLFSSKT